MDLFIYCAGGFGVEIMDLARQINASRHRWERIRFIDDVRAEREFYGTELYSYRDAISRFSRGTYEVAIAHGEPAVRKVLYQKLVADTIPRAALIADSAIVSQSAQLGDGVLVCPFCFVSSRAVLKDNVALNTQALVGHDVLIQEHCVVSIAASFGGGSSLGTETYVGMGAQIKDGAHVGSQSIIGMGSIVFQDIPDGVVALGNPARVMRNNTEQRVFK